MVKFISLIYLQLLLCVCCLLIKPHDVVVCVHVLCTVIQHCVCIDMCLHIITTQNANWQCVCINTWVLCCAHSCQHADTVVLLCCAWVVNMNWWCCVYKTVYWCVTTTCQTVLCWSPSTCHVHMFAIMWNHINVSWYNMPVVWWLYWSHVIDSNWISMLYVVFVTCLHNVIKWVLWQSVSIVCVHLCCHPLVFCCAVLFLIDHTWGCLTTVCIMW